MNAGEQLLSGAPARLRGAGRGRGRRARPQAPARGLCRAHAGAPAARAAAAAELARAGRAADGADGGRGRRREPPARRRLAEAASGRPSAAADRGRRRARARARRRLHRDGRAAACARSGPPATATSRRTARTPCSPPARSSWPCTWPTARCAGACPRPAPSRCRAGRASARCRRAAASPISRAARSTSSAATARARTALRRARAGGGARVASARQRARARLRRAGRHPHRLGRQPRAGAARSAAAQRVTGLSWRADGRVLAVLDATGVTLYSAAGKRLERVAVRGGTLLDGGFAAEGNRLVVLRRDTSGRVSLLVRGSRGPLRAVRHLTLTAVGDLRLSPDGRSALVASREGDEWIDIRLRDGRLRRLRDVGHAAARRVRPAGARLGGLTTRQLGAAASATTGASRVPSSGSTSNSLAGQVLHARAERLEERVRRLEEADAPPCGSASARRAAAAAHGRSAAAALAADGRPVADRQEQHVDLADRRLLLGPQGGLPEVAEVAEAETVEREAEDRVGAALRAGDVVVLGGDADHLAERRVVRARRSRAAIDRRARDRPRRRCGRRAHASRAGGRARSSRSPGSRSASRARQGPPSGRTGRRRPSARR